MCRNSNWKDPTPTRQNNWLRTVTRYTRQNRTLFPKQPRPGTTENQLSPPRERKGHLLLQQRVTRHLVESIFRWIYTLSDPLRKTRPEQGVTPDLTVILERVHQAQWRLRTGMNRRRVLETVITSFIIFQ